MKKKMMLMIAVILFCLGTMAMFFQIGIGAIIGFVGAGVIGFPALLIEIRRVVGLDETV